ncbi:MAG: hypothetical protein EXR67_03600 [Dehalococcoidia bacterium]|nr:hypothetical protein [Dehalococcoidia bacterium]
MLTFERGDQAKPKGHALLYFKDADDPSKLVSTYVVVLPVTVDIVKYLPPFLASQAAELGKGTSAFAFPPVPEASEGQDHLNQIADARGDDLLFGGTVSLAQVPYLLTAVNDVVQRYGEAYQAHISTLPAPSIPAAAAQSGTFNVDDILYQLMSDRDRLAEMTKFIGTLRFALDGRDENLVKDSGARVQSLGKCLPERYLAEDLLKAAQNPSRKGASLAQLYLERCYKLLDGNQQAVLELDERIRTLQASPSDNILERSDDT